MPAIAVCPETVAARGAEYEGIVAAANVALAKQVSGEDPRNDCSPRHKALARALDYFRGDIDYAVTRYEMGHFTAAVTLELIELAAAAINAIVECQ